ncbi:hypothetical protein AOLI_G00189140 [Acnodon oligacanthus]
MTSKTSSSEEQHPQKAEGLVQRQANCSTELGLNQRKRPDSPGPSRVSTKSDQSVNHMIHFREDISSGLRLSGCMATAEGCSSLASALKSNPSRLRELDLTYNHPGESGMKGLSDLLKDPRCKLEKLQFL